jgi:Sulfotransferase domain
VDSSAVPPLVKRVAHFGSRTVGLLSARHRMTPAFLIAGGQRCGTTSLHRALAQHPAILKAVLHKGVHYFDTDYHRGPEWYLAHFPLLRTARAVERHTGLPALTFESAPYYMYHPLAAERIAADLPAAKIICLLRDPVERAYSQHAHEVARGYEKVTDFARALSMEPRRLAGEEERLRTDPGYHSRPHQHHGYRARGRYVDYLDRLAGELGRDRIHVVDSADFFAEPELVLQEVLDFLELPPMGRIRFEQHNARPRSAPMPQPVREELTEFFAPYDRRLADWWGREPSWRLRPARHRSSPALPASEPPMPDGKGARDGSAADRPRPAPTRPSPAPSPVTAAEPVRAWTTQVESPATVLTPAAAPAPVAPSDPPSVTATAAVAAASVTAASVTAASVTDALSDSTDALSDGDARPAAPPAAPTPKGGNRATPNAGNRVMPNGGNSATPNRGNRATPNAGSSVMPPGGIRAMPPGGNRAMPNGGPSVTPPGGNRAMPPGGARGLPTEVVRGLAIEPDRDVAAEPAPAAGEPDAALASPQGPGVERQRVVAVEPPHGLLFGAPRSRGTTGVQPGRGEIASHRSNGNNGAGTGEHGHQPPADPGQPDGAPEAAHGRGKRARHGAASGRGRQ